jgi:rhamnogalacturonan endolyase
MGSWGGTFAVDSSKNSDFPMALWSKQSGAATVNFSLTKEEVKNYVFDIGTILSFKSGRPTVQFGSWTGKDPGASSKCRVTEQVVLAKNFRN